MVNCNLSTYTGTLALHFVLTATVAGLLVIRYLTVEDTDTFDMKLTIMASAGILAFGLALLSAVNWIQDMIISEPEKLAKKSKLGNNVLNTIRNLLSVVVFLLCGILAGVDSILGDGDHIMSWIVLICALLVRFVDMQLDTGNILSVQCPDSKADEELGTKNSDTKTVVFVTLCLLASTIGLWIYNFDVADGANTDDDTYLLLAAILVTVHTLLALFQTLLAVSPLDKIFINFIKKDCDGTESLHMINEIPAVTKLVFSGAIFFLSLTLGNRYKDGQAVHSGAAILAVLALADLVSRGRV